MDNLIKVARINGQSVTFNEGETILEVARRMGIFIPTLCEFAALNHRPGTCRMCLTEVTKANGVTQMVTACETRVEDGDVINTRAKRVRQMQKLQAELLFADHCETCSSCARHGACELQTVAKQVGLDVTTMSGRLATRKPTVDRSAPGLVFTADKCIRCLRCIEACRSVQGLGVMTLNHTGTGAAIGFAGDRWGDSDTCIQCGQCALVCPTGALAVKDQIETALDWFSDDTIKTVVQFAPAVRLAVAEGIGLPAGINLEGQVIAALKALGADYVMDTRWGADVTIMEEGTEFLERLEAQKKAGTLARPTTMFTSCCPGWVTHVEKNAPDMIPYLSSTRSPQAIFGALSKTWLPKVLNVEPTSLRTISIMPCTAKKGEASRAQLARDGRPDTDLVLTIQEFLTLLERTGIDLKSLMPATFDSLLMSEASGAAQLFATTGGVMEAALRTVTALTGGPALAKVAFEPVRGLETLKEATIDTITFGPLRVAVVYGMRTMTKVIDMVRAGTCPYHFVEVMACPGGCIGGGGTVRGRTWGQTLEARQSGVYATDNAMPIRASHENPDVIKLYREYLGKPGSALAHDLLHCGYEPHQKHAETPTYEAIEANVELANG